MIRPTCAVLGLLALFLQGSSGGHMLLVEHTRCAEHGELVHGAQGHVDEAASESGRSFRGVPGEESATAHDHCLLATERRHAVEPVVDAQLADVVRIDEASDLVCLVDVTLIENAPRFRVAPKTSPPA